MKTIGNRIYYLVPSLLLFAHLPLDVALVKYDKVAERFGFEQRRDKNWYKTL